jgi:hypothetical protein
LRCAVCACVCVVSKGFASVGFMRINIQKADVLGTCLSHHGQHQGKSTEEESQAHVRKLDVDAWIVLVSETRGRQRFAAVKRIGQQW